MKQEIKNKKIISLTQILILVIGIFAFSYMIGEIGKQRGIEISRGIGIVSAQKIEGNNCDTPNEKVCSNDNKIVLQCSPGDQLWTKTDDCGQDSCMGGECATYNQGYKYENEKIPDQVDANKDKNLNGGEILGYGSSGLSIANGIKSLLTKKTAEEIAKKATEGALTNVANAGPAASSLWAKLFMGAPASGSEAAGTASYTTASLTMNWIGSFVAVAGTAALIYFIFKAAGAGQQNLNMIANAGLVGAGVGFAASMLPMFFTIIGTSTTAGPVGWIAAAVTAVFMGFWILFGYQDYVLEIITYEISSWQAVEKGENCEKCNNLEFGCTEYQCKTFGQGCGIVNEGTKQERCVWLNPDDREYPIITENITISQLPENYNYKKSTAISPPDTGVEITSTSNKCIPPFSSLNLGVTTDEPAQCRISSERKKNFEDMVRDMDEGTVKIEKHTKILPNSATANAWALNNLVNNSALPNDTEFEITKGNEYEYYIKCKDTNGNENDANFVIKFCVQDKDLTAPIIKGFFVADGSFVQFNTPDLVTEVYTNEPAECKWDFSDKTYNEMQYGMTNCDTTISQASVQGNSCTGNFTGLKNGEENKYYIRCQDRSEDKNTNTASEIYTLKVSDKSILIDSVTVNGKGNNSIIKDSRDVIPIDLEIKTSFGAQDGKAKCNYKYLGNEISMSFDYKEVNTQTLWLPEGKYELPISCNDIAGDSATDSISFTIMKDTEAPIVARAYYDVNNLKVITNEPAKCVYTLQSNIGCAYNFADGTAMKEIGELTHYTSWESGKKYYIKCKDAFGNQPLLPNQCSIIVKAFESYK